MSDASVSTREPALISTSRHDRIKTERQKKAAERDARERQREMDKQALQV